MPLLICPLVITPLHYTPLGNGSQRIPRKMEVRGSSPLGSSKDGPVVIATGRFAGSKSADMFGLRRRVVPTWTLSRRDCSTLPVLLDAFSDQQRLSANRLTVRRTQKILQEFVREACIRVPREITTAAVQSYLAQ